MARKRPYLPFKNITVEPGAEWSLSVTFTFVRCHKSNQAEFEIGIDGEAPFSFREGDKFKLPEADEEAQHIRIRNIGVTTLIVDLGLGFGDFSAEALQFNGAVDVAPAANGFATGKVPVALLATLVLAANANRTRALISAGAGDLIIGPTNTVTTATGRFIGAGDDFEVRHRGEVWAIRNSGSFDASIYEEVQ